jgi:hypothetical protein
LRKYHDTAPLSYGDDDVGHFRRLLKLFLTTPIENLAAVVKIEDNNLEWCPNLSHGKATTKEFVYERGEEDLNSSINCVAIFRRAELEHYSISTTTCKAARGNMTFEFQTTQISSSMHGK